MKSADTPRSTSQKVLCFLNGHRMAHTLSEISRESGIEPSETLHCLNALINKGMVTLPSSEIREPHYFISAKGEAFIKRGGYNKAYQLRRWIRKWWGGQSKWRRRTLTVCAIISTFSPIIIYLLSQRNQGLVSANLRLFHQPLPAYPSAENIQVIVYLPNTAPIPLMFADVHDDRPVKFPSDDMGVKCKVVVNGAYWKAAVDSIPLNVPLQLELIPNGKLAVVQGKVTNLTKTAPISGAEVQLGSLSVLTDIQGYFKMNVPLQMQRKKQVLTVIVNSVPTPVPVNSWDQELSISLGTPNKNP